MGLSQERSSSQSPRSPAGAPFLSISVTDPVKMGTGVQAYISYRVITRVKILFGLGYQTTRELLLV